MGPTEGAISSLHQLPSALYGALEVLLGVLSPNQVDSKSSWHLEFAPPSLVQPAPLVKHTVVTKASPNWSHMSGTWIKDKKASDSMEPVLQLMQMRGLVRQAIKLVKGINIKHKDNFVTVEVFSVIGWFKVVERYNLNGAPAFFRRRDLRRGQHEGKIRQMPPLWIERPKAGLKTEQRDEQPADSFVLDLSWGEPHAGSGWDVYELKAPDVMHVHSTVKVGEAAVQTTSVFNRKK